MKWQKKRFLILLGAVYLVLCVSLAFNPAYRPAWWMENATVWVLLAITTLVTLRGTILSYTSYSIIFIGLVFHTIGGYYTFQAVPLGDWVASISGLDRNPYDHIGHFLCGCFAYPAAEYFSIHSIGRTKGICAFFAICLMMAVAALYEIWEWASIIFTEELTRLTFIGAQGEEWDCQVDMFSCLCGALALAGLFCLQKRRLG